MDATSSPASSHAAIALDAFRAMRSQFPPPQVLDVRRAAAFERDPSLIPGAVRCAPEDVDAAASSLEPWRPVVTVCVHGHEVSRNAASQLRARGDDARALDGGHEQWRAEGGATLPWRAPTQWVLSRRPCRAAIARATATAAGTQAGNHGPPG